MPQTRRGAVSLVLVGACLALDATPIAAQTLSFIREINAADRDSAAQSIAVDATGVYVFGNGPFTLPSPPLPPTLPTVWGRKFDRKGNELWSRQLDDCCLGGATADETGVYVWGSGTRGAYLRKYDQGGREVWTRPFPGPFNITNSRVVTDSTGIYVATGLYGTSGGAVPAQRSIVKFDLNGSPLWTKGFDPSELMTNGALAVAGGSIYLAGGSFAQPGFRVRRYDPEGHELWPVSLSIDSTDVGGAPHIAADASGFYVTHYGAGGFLYLTKYGADRHLIWERGIFDVYRVSDLTADGAGVYVSGNTGTDDFYTGGIFGQCRNGNFDSYVIRFDTEGNKIWTSEFGWADSVRQGARVAAVDSNAIYVAGDFLAVLDKAPAVIPASKPYISPGCVVNAASKIGGAVAAGEIVTISGSMIGPAQAVSFDSAQQPLPTILSGTRILFNGVPAPLLYVSAKESSAIVPYSIRDQSAVDVQVEYQGLLSGAVTMPVRGTRPGIYDSFLNEDGSRNSLGNPAQLGSVVSLYGTGGGEFDAAVTDGQILQSVVPKIDSPVTASFQGGPEGWLSAEVLYAGGVPGLPAGVFQLNLRVPLGARTGNFAPLIVSVGSQQVLGLTIALR